MKKNKAKKSKVKPTNYRVYEKAPKGFLTRCYSNMRQRVNGEQNKDKPHLYKNKNLSIMSKEEFFNFARTSLVFWSLYSAWAFADFDQRLTPSPDRKDPDKGYVVSNLQWVSYSENCRLARKANHSKNSSTI